VGVVSNIGGVLVVGVVGGVEGFVRVAGGADGLDFLGAPWEGVQGLGEFGEDGAAGGGGGGFDFEIAVRKGGFGADLGADAGDFGSMDAAETAEGFGGFGGADDFGEMEVGDGGIVRGAGDAPGLGKRAGWLIESAGYRAGLGGGVVADLIGAGRYGDDVDEVLRAFDLA